MTQKVVILPLDDYSSSHNLFEALKIVNTPGLVDLVSHIKLNDGIHLGGAGFVEAIYFELAKNMHTNVKIFLDLKIYDVSATLVNVLKKYKDIPIIDILTVSSQCSVEGIAKLRKLLPRTKLAMVSILTDIDESQCRARYGQSPEIKIYNDLMNIRYFYQKQAPEFQKSEPFDLLVCSPHELKFLGKNLPNEYGFVVPGIRDEWMKKADEHQKRTTGVKEALNNRATYVVMGAQIIKGNPELNITPEKSRQLTMNEIAKANKRLVVKDDPLRTLKNCDACYVSPGDGHGGYAGPLVAYAGKYDDDSGSKNYVGFEYFNFAKAEVVPSVRNYFAGLLSERITASVGEVDTIIGAPMGGILLAGSVGDNLQCRTIFAEKKVVAVAAPEQGIKEESLQIIDRHEIYPGDKVIVIEDVCNNFSTTQKLKELIEGRGGTLTAIACAVNRSGKGNWEGIPVISALYVEARQFKQDDPEVAELVEIGNVVWKPKTEWKRLKQAMKI